MFLLVEGAFSQLSLGLFSCEHLQVEKPASGTRRLCGPVPPIVRCKAEAAAFLGQVQNDAVTKTFNPCQSERESHRLDPNTFSVKRTE